MPRSRTATRQRILDGAYTLFYRQGFARTSMDEIAAGAGVAKRTLYAHYDSKDSLLADVLERQHELAIGRIDDWAKNLTNGGDAAVDMVFADIISWSAGPHWTGSGFTRLVMELADLPGHPARKIASRHKTAVEERLSALFGSGQFGAELMLVIEGALTLLLVHGDRRYGEIAAAAAKRLLGAYRSDTSNKSTRHDRSRGAT
jgi:AcrR family transcriptional regulator